MTSFFYFIFDKYKLYSYSKKHQIYHKKKKIGAALFRTIHRKQKRLILWILSGVLHFVGTVTCCVFLYLHFQCMRAFTLTDMATRGTKSTSMVHLSLNYRHHSYAAAWDLQTLSNLWKWWERTANMSYLLLLKVKHQFIHLEISGSSEPSSQQQIFWQPTMAATWLSFPLSAQ